MTTIERLHAAGYATRTTKYGDLLVVPEGRDAESGWTADDDVITAVRALVGEGHAVSYTSDGKILVADAVSQ